MFPNDFVFGPPKDVRLGVAHTHVIPSGDFGAGIWHTMTQADQAKVSRAITDVYRLVDGCKRAAPGAGVAIKTDSQVVIDLQVMAPLHKILFARIRILFHIALRRRTDLLCLLHACKKDSSSWYALVKADLEVVAACTHKLSEMRGATMGAWLAYFCRNGKKALLPIKEAFIGMTASQSSTVAAPQGIATFSWACDLCPTQFVTRQGMIAHQVRHHLKLRVARAFVKDGRCPCCLRHFHTRTRLLDHLHKKSEICFLNVMLRLAPLTQREIEQADYVQWKSENDYRKRGLNKAHAESMVSQMFGPMQVIVVPKEHSRKNRYPLFFMALECSKAAIEVDFDLCLEAISDNGFQDPVDQVPLSVLAALT